MIDTRDEHCIKQPLDEKTAIALGEAAKILYMKYSKGKPMTETLTDDDRSIIEHSLGIEYKKGRNRKLYRNHYCASEGDARLESLAERGLMKRGGTINGGTNRYFYVTELGANAVGSKLPDEACS